MKEYSGFLVNLLYYKKIIIKEATAVTSGEKFILFLLHVYYFYCMYTIYTIFITISNVGSKEGWGYHSVSLCNPQHFHIP